MKIGIFTIFDAYNYGSFLQAFAMQNILEERGHQVEIIDIRESLRSVIAQKYFAKSFSRSLLKLRRFINYRKDWKDLNIVSIKNASVFDLAIIGSDEVWNIENPSFDHSERFYGYNIKADKIIAYAPSLGYSTFNSYKKFPNLLKGIKTKINWFGVRDKFTKNFLKEIGVNDVNLICDPTILLSNRWKELGKPIKERAPYLIYYSYHEDTPYKNIILNFAREKGLKLITVGFNYKWCDEQIICSPLEFLSYIDKADYIVTSTFHGTLFSVIYEKKFIQVTPALKAVDFLEQIGINRKIESDNYSQFKELLEKDIDYSQVRATINNLKDYSINLLEKENGV